MSEEQPPLYGGEIVEREEKQYDMFWWQIWEIILTCFDLVE